MEYLKTEEWLGGVYFTVVYSIPWESIFVNLVTEMGVECLVFVGVCFGFGFGFGGSVHDSF